MSYHLASCLRFIEATHVVEILREHRDPGRSEERRVGKECGDFESESGLRYASVIYADDLNSSSVLKTGG